MTSILSVECRNTARSRLWSASKYPARSNVRTVTQLQDQTRKAAVALNHNQVYRSCIAPGGGGSGGGDVMEPATSIYGVKLYAESCAKSRRARDRYREWYSAKVERLWNIGILKLRGAISATREICKPREKG
ncbi:hypothetical protein G5I_12408 [Acromyrmex echinatior]|uniref:Uncharacterized protein n=1 Tax=Acromyrmex echinatior TaxID=103372 RepID=F4X286_ACREC|nr:hypothetical protein G5I_12408 [Acromyrmex echinatior]